MKFTLKTLKQVPYDVEFESDSITVEELKKITENKHGIEADSIKLVFNGVVLKNENTVSSYKIPDGGVLILMIAKTKAHNKPEENVQEKPVTATTTTTTTITNNTVSNNNVNNVNNEQPKTTTTVPKTTTAPKDYTEEVKTLVEMGFPKDYSETAIKAAKGNITIAIEFLYNGIPENVNNLEEEPLSNNGSQQDQEGSGGELSIVRRIASIVKVLCSNDPSKLQEIILSLQQTQPELIELIKQNEAEFKTLIAQPVSEEDIAVFQNFNAGMGGQGSRSQGGSGQGGNRSGRQEIMLSKPEYEAVQRLKEFGFSEMDAVQAYFACDKNEEAALNMLFDMKNQDSTYDDNKGNDNK